MSRLRIEPLPLSTFTFCRSTRSLVAEASDFGGAFKISRLYDDACDEGIIVKSDVSNRSETFYFVDVDRTPDGEIAGWRFKPEHELANVVELLVIND